VELFSWFSTQSQLKLVRGLCVEAARASIGVPVHRVGNLCKTSSPLFAQRFFALAVSSALKNVPVCARGASKLLSTNPQ
jgi:hypothetical protein